MTSKLVRFGMALAMMVTAPLMVLFYDRTFVAGTFGAALRQRRRFYVFLAATWLPLIWLVVRPAIWLVLSPEMEAADKLAIWVVVRPAGTGVTSVVRTTVSVVVILASALA